MSSGKLKGVLSSLVDIYEKLLSANMQERESLVNMDTENMIRTIEIEQYLSLKIQEHKTSLKNILQDANAENVSEFLFLASKNEDVDDLRILNGKLQTLVSQFERDKEINKMIVEENISFYNNIMDLYSTILDKKSQRYNKDAEMSVNHINKAVSVRV